MFQMVTITETAKRDFIDEIFLKVMLTWRYITYITRPTHKRPYHPERHISELRLSSAHLEPRHHWRRQLLQRSAGHRAAERSYRAHDDRPDAAAEPPTQLSPQAGRRDTGASRKGRGAEGIGSILGRKFLPAAPLDSGELVR